MSDHSKTDAVQFERRVTDSRVTLFQRWPTPPPTITDAVLVVVTRWLELADAALVHSEGTKPRHRRVALSFST
jgi:hypothetical protein